MWGEWIEIVKIAQMEICTASLPVWGEWIEMLLPVPSDRLLNVSPRVGRVD